MEDIFNKPYRALLDISSNTLCSVFISVLSTYPSLIAITAFFLIGLEEISSGLYGKEPPIKPKFVTNLYDNDALISVISDSLSSAGVTNPEHPKNN